MSDVQAGRRGMRSRCALRACAARRSSELRAADAASTVPIETTITCVFSAEKSRSARSAWEARERGA